ncbi:MAG TPA: hypothetical protein PLM53_12840 [Spirochaetota bacterium]|nr:hypothetical protein [Spirochaetota bacterium]HPL17872.1 hypothetical protein [Spirochaetota bacterium]HQF09404.1 hypothetical protein [Spirochaetota bacterium]HQH97982.1 hypothetical protein [Spirochaetota bacterium]HQJ71127.1 hypothetical protein [Spirochaetota bacterium]
MRVILDYLYANQIIGLITTIILIIGITFFITRIYPFDDFKGLPGIKKVYYGLVIGASILLCVFLIILATVNPLNIGRAGAIRQAVILKNTIVFSDLYSLGGSELGDTPHLLRVWVLDRKTGALITRKSIDSEDPILGANDTSLLIGEEGDCYLTDDRLKATNRIVSNGWYGKKKIHKFAFHNGALVLSFKDFSESRVSLPLVARRAGDKSGIDFRFMDTDRETYRVTRRINDRIVWQLDQSEGTMREHIPDLLYESPSNDLYLLWTEYRLKAISKKTGTVVWMFWY